MHYNKTAKNFLGGFIMETNYISIGKKIRTHRKKRGLSQFELAAAVFCSPPYISLIEGGKKSMSLDTFILIANALNATADELLSDNLVNTVKVSNHEFASLLADCSDFEKKVMYDLAVATKASLRKNQSR